MTHKNSRTEKKKKRQNNQSKKKKSLLFKILVTLILLMIAAILTGGSLFAYYASQAPTLNKEDLIDPIASEVLDKNGDVITRLGTENRELIDYEDIPLIVEEAVLATEDIRFYDHYGVDPIRLGKAVFANITEGFGSEGASTITQQVIKQSFLTSEKSLERKAQEAWLAFKFEQDYSKTEILEMYLNKTYYSDSIYGIETAANYYFDKSIDELSLSESALLAGIPQSPNNYNPYDYPEKATERRNTVLYLMNYHDQITVEEMEQAQQVAITDDVVERDQEERAQLTNNQGDKAFIDYVVEQLDEMGNYNIFEDGLTIHTTLDPDAQSNLEEILNSDDMIDFPADKNGEPFQAGVTLLDTQSGAIRAIGGGRNYGSEVQRGFNFATDISRQPGSVIKPLLDYAPAIENNQWSTAHIIEDEAFEYEDGGEPENWDGEFKGEISIREALWDSRNIPAIKVFNEVGHENAVEFINGLGFNYDEEEVYESSAIGGGSGTNPTEIAGAYAAFGNKGVYNEPYAITKVERRDGSVEEFSYETNAAMKASTAYMITDMLKEVIENPQGTGTTAAVSGLEIAGKTGTTNYTDDFKQANNIDSGGAPDSWFAGYTTQYTAAIWTGYKDRSNPLSQTERKTAQKLFSSLMSEISGEDIANFERPDNILEIEVEKGSDPVERASAYTPVDQISAELFLEGHEPSEVSDQFVPDLSPPSNSTNEEDDDGDSTESDSNSASDSEEEETEASSETDEEESTETEEESNNSNEEEETTEETTEETEPSSDTEGEESTETDDGSNSSNEEEESTEETEEESTGTGEETSDETEEQQSSNENETSSETAEEETADTDNESGEGDQQDQPSTE
ncbi:transglycosylase domain-containing protein [Paraliobacillus zengyii]|uniref:transglycosylase domain-containing protein n=1 Tax=Paraliobacillus zengyii TaxID=2213194 RepID=UPI000DD4E81D|nr:PBP1A family penicillin-binding protein [Paraliobacillus zengyii]